MSKNAQNTSSRYRFSIRPNNKAVIKWIEKQGNLSESLSTIIIDAIQQYGYRDVTAYDVSEVSQQPRRGRPAKTFVDNFVPTELGHSGEDNEKQSADVFSQEQTKEPVFAAPPVRQDDKKRASSTASAIAQMMGD